MFGLKSLYWDFGSYFIYINTCRGMSRAGGKFRLLKRAEPLLGVCPHIRQIRLHQTNILRFHIFEAYKFIQYT